MMTPKGAGRIRSIAGLLRRFAGCRRGTSSVEFVLVLGPMVLFLFGIIGFGLITYAHNNMVNAAREATRRLSVAEDVVVASNTATITNDPVACGSPAYDILVTAANDASKKAAEQIACDYLAGWAITFEVTSSECVTGRDVTVRISTDASEAFMVDLWGLFAGDLEAWVTMRREAACA
jgi:Flp pilus assembly protein TadG